MLREPTTEKLRAMRLEAMAAAWNEQSGKPEIASLSFDERFGMLIDAEWTHRENKRLNTALREAKLKLSSACIEDLDYSPRRELDRPQLRQLATCRWVAEHQNVIITGATGTGKTYLGCALAQLACRKGYRALYRRASRLFSELALARADGSHPRALAKLARMDVLVIDDWAMGPISDTERRDLLEVLEDRYGLRSTIVTSQLSYKRWHEHIADPTHADAICDRLIHNAHKLMLKNRRNASPRSQKPTSKQSITVPIAPAIAIDRFRRSRCAGFGDRHQ
jgi:DNA replication protein DnaC